MCVAKNEAFNFTVGCSEMDGGWRRELPGQTGQIITKPFSGFDGGYKTGFVPNIVLLLFPQSPSTWVLMNCTISWLLEGTVNMAVVCYGRITLLLNSKAAPDSSGEARCHSMFERKQVESEDLTISAPSLWGSNNAASHSIQDLGTQMSVEVPREDSLVSNL